MTDHDLHALSGAYALDALDADERARFEAHLMTCADCREEVASLQEAAALLGTEPVEPPAAVRDAVLAGIESIRPLPPVTGRTATVTSIVRRSRVLLSAAAAVVLLGLGVAVVQPWADDPSVEEQIAAASDATRVVQDFPDGSTATVIVSRSEGKALIRTEDMALAPAGKVYELWLQTPAGEMVPAGLMPDDPDTTLVLDGDAAQATAVGITVEPDGGSTEPTTEPIALFALDS